MSWSRDLFRSLWRALSKEVREHVGTDQLGNKYYCVPEYKNWRGQTIREKRLVEAANKKEVNYEVGDIPTEWEDHHQTCLRVYYLYPLFTSIYASGEQTLHLFDSMLYLQYLKQYIVAWIRRTRKTPPTMEEILKNEKYREEIKTTSKDYHEKEKHLSKETKELLAPPVQTQIKGHASAPYFGKEEPSVAPTSTGKTFQPGSWMPQDGKSHNQ